MSTHLDPCLSTAIASHADGAVWAREVPSQVERLRSHWSLTMSGPLRAAGNDGTGSWVAGVTLADGTRAVLKLGFPHFEGRDEIAGLAFWNGESTVRLLASDVTVNAMLLERCVPGHSLRSRPDAEQDLVLTGLLRNVWREPTRTCGLRPLAEQIRFWCETTREQARGRGTDRELDAALAELERLCEPGAHDVTLTTDLHAGNVLAATRAPWLIIDPKPFVGDPAYDVTQHLLNSPERLAGDPCGFVKRVAALAGVEAVRVRRWLAARLVAEPGADYVRSREIARRLLA